MKKTKGIWLGAFISTCRERETTSVESYSSWSWLFPVCWNSGGEGRGQERTERKRDDLWALGEGEPHEYPSLSRGERRARGKKGLDGGVWGEEERELTERLTTSSILGLFWVCVYVCMCLYSKCGAVRVRQVLLFECSTLAVWAESCTIGRVEQEWLFQTKFWG